MSVRVRGRISRCDIRGHRDHRRSPVDYSSQNSGGDEGTHLLRVDHPPNIEACGIEELVRFVGVVDIVDSFLKKLFCYAGEYIYAAARASSSV